MGRILTTMVAVAAVGVMGCTAAAGERGTGPKAAPVKVKEPLVQLAILLDTSGSMSGLIDQARNQLWRVVDEVGRTHRGGVAPRLELALYEYGKTGLPREIRQILPFTTDLDRVSSELFALTTHGGQEYCGEVIDRATRDLTWSADPDALKMIFIAGNEPFTQGPLDPYAAIDRAHEKGIAVNVIHCGGDEPTWKKGALVAKTDFMKIDHNRYVVDVAAPQDAELARLNEKLNDTYLPYGARGREGAAAQAAEDRKAASVSGSTIANRAKVKGSKMYTNSHWDLVDAVREEKVDVTRVDDAALPSELRGLPPAAKKASVEAKARERAQIQKRISELGEERRRYVEAERAKQAGAESLDSAMIRSVRNLSTAKGLKVD